MIGLSVSGGKPFLNTYLFKYQHFFGRNSVNRAVSGRELFFVDRSGWRSGPTKQASLAWKCSNPRSQRGVVGAGYTADGKGDCVSDAALSCPDKILYDARILSLQ